METLFNQDVGTAGVDGLYGGDTAAALRRALPDLGLETISAPDDWVKFLQECANGAIAAENTIMNM